MIREYFTNHNETSTLIIEDGKIKAIKNKNITEKSIRVFDEQKHVFALAAGIGNVSDAELEAKAVNLLSLNMPYEYELERDSQAEFVKDKLNVTDIEGFTQKFLDDLKDICPDFVQSGDTNISTYKNEIRNDLNLHLSKVKRNIACDIMLKQKGSGNIMDAYTSISGFEITPEKYSDVLKTTELVCKTCRSDVVPLTSGEYKILFHGFGLLGKFSRDICGEPYETKSSLLAGRLGEQIFHPDITLYDTPDNEEYEAFIPYDHEGIIRTHELPIVENGVLKTIIYNKKSAQRYGKTSTGNGFRNYNSNPSTTIRQLICPMPTVPATELIAEDTVILTLQTSGGDILPNGNYSFPIQLGIVFKNGVFMGKAPQLTITGNYLDSLNKDFIAIGKNDILKGMEQPALIFTKANVVVH